MTTIAQEKAALRAQALARRATLDPQAGAALAEIVLREIEIAVGATIAGVWPLPGEIDLRPLLHAFHARGHEIVLPETPPRGQRLVFRRWSPGCAMIRERFGTYRPDGEIAEPDLIFVPLLAFDGDGNRLGYGGGFYDRTLQALPGRRAVGFAHAAQRVARVPVEAHDQPLSFIATEAGLLRRQEESLLF
jgi:5-formyltetrahydrofolate cyclo-ligase